MFGNAEEDYYQSEPEAPNSPFKQDLAPQLQTAISNDHKDSLSQSSPFHSCSDHSELDDSDFLDKQLIQTNVLQLKTALEQYFIACSSNFFGKTDKIQNRNSFLFQKTTSPKEQDSTLSALITQNPLLHPPQQLFLKRQFKQRSELRLLLSEIENTLSKNIARQLTLVIYTLLLNKMQHFQDILQENQLELLPKFERIWGDQDRETYPQGKWSVFEDIDYNTIRKFANNNENIANQLYFNQQLTQITLRQETNTNDILDKFICLVNFISQTLFLSLSGISQPEQALTDYTYEFYLQQFQGQLQQTKLNKRIKLQ